MKHEEKAALLAGASTFLIAGGIAAVLGTPVAMASAIYGTYKLTKGVYQSAKLHSKK